MTHLWDIVTTVLGYILVIAVIIYCGYRALQRSDDPGKLAFKWVLTVAIIAGGIYILRGFPRQFWVVVVLFPAVAVGLIWAPSFANMVAQPLSGMFDGGTQEVERRPYYSIAETKRRKGFPQEAADAVRAELEKFPFDVTGTLLLAAILAEDLKDISGARQVIHEWLARPDLPAPGATAVSNAMADWELQIAKDPEAARAWFDRIVRNYPGTQWAHQAEQRLAHLPTSEHLQALAEGSSVELREGQKYIGLRTTTRGAVPEPESESPGDLADKYIEQLERHPTDTDTREKLASLYAEQYNRMDLASDQLEQLIAMPTETPKHIARWLNLKASLQIKTTGDRAAAEQTLKRIIDTYPQSAAATQAFERLASLNSELRATHTTSSKKLGNYEKDIGLKQPRV
jgi:tetratricopeptide (TPR) repeat protein